MVKLSVLSFFSGCGFLDLGFEKSGFNIVYVNEIHKPFLDAYKYSRLCLNIPPPKYGYCPYSITFCFSDTETEKIKNILVQEKKNDGLVGFIGGPPCPDFSVAGKNQGKFGENGILSLYYIELICLFQPDFFVFENVKGLWKTRKHREFFEQLKNKLIDNGYELTERLINAIEYAVPQNRERIILFGIKKEKLKNVSIQDFPWNKFTSYPNKTAFLFDWPSIGEIILPKLTPKELTVNFWFEKNDVLNHPNTIHVFVPRAGLTKFKIIKEGDDSKKSYKRLHRYKYSPTAAYGNNEVHIHPMEPRRINVAEALAIQSLPKEFELPPYMTLTNMFKSIGNGVPYLAARGIALTIYDFIKQLNYDTTNKS